ncbi:MAG: hypothetical protein ACK5CA_03340 [Cyanobacteriota bacterium]
MKTKNLLLLAALTTATLSLPNPAQALQWNFSYSGSNDDGEVGTFSGTLTTQEDVLVQGNTYTVIGSTGNVTYTDVGGLDEPATATGTFKWDGTNILLNFEGISFLLPSDTSVVLSRIYSSTSFSTDDYSATNFWITIPTANPLNQDLKNNVVTTLGPATPVPIESDALPIVGAAAFMADGIWYKRRRAQAKANLDFLGVASEK